MNILYIYIVPWEASGSYKVPIYRFPLPAGTDPFQG